MTILGYAVPLHTLLWGAVLGIVVIGVAALGILLTRARKMVRQEEGPDITPAE